MKIVFATHNKNKLQEVQQLMPKNIELLSLTDIGCYEEILEISNSLEGNAQLKADHVTKSYGYNCFADDTGLEVAILNGAPGVYSARYAGESKNASANIKKLISELDGKSDRSAQFRTVIALNLNDGKYLFEGICAGEILKMEQGEEGFGYDPIFKPDGFNKSFAAMSMEAKGRISHRGIVIRNLIDFLENV